MTPDQYDTDERLDAGLDKMLDGFEWVTVKSTSRWAKTITLHGYKVELVDDRESPTCFVVRMPMVPLTDAAEYVSISGAPSRHFFYEADKPAAYTAALEWADRMAFGYFAMEMALYATTTEPHYVAGGDECEPWHGLATHIVRQLDAEEGMYIADVSADLSSYECGPCVGGKITIPLSSDKDDPREIAIRCELVWSMRVADRLLAVYEFSRC